MTIEKGKEWGTQVSVETPVKQVSSDHELSAQPQNFCVYLSGGNIYNSLGSPRPPEVGETRQMVEVDALSCHITLMNNTTSEIHAASDVAIGTFLRWGMSQERFVVISNSGIMQQRNFAPRAHPNDGKWDVVSFAPNMSLRQRLIALKRLKTGSHIPHPDISLVQTTQLHIEKEHNHQCLVIDGTRIKDWKSISVQVIPDYWRIIV